jgi:hypothetical protein
MGACPERDRRKAIESKGFPDKRATWNSGKHIAPLPFAPAGAADVGRRTGDDLSSVAPAGAKEDVGRETSDVFGPTSPLSPTNPNPSP